MPLQIDFQYLVGIVLLLTSVGLIIKIYEIRTTVQPVDQKTVKKGIRVLAIAALIILSLAVIFLLHLGDDIILYFIREMSFSSITTSYLLQMSFVASLELSGLLGGLMIADIRVTGITSKPDKRFIILFCAFNLMVIAAWVTASYVKWGC